MNPRTYVVQISKYIFLPALHSRHQKILYLGCVNYLGGLILIFFPISLLPIIYRLQFSKKSAYFFKPRGGLGRWLMRRGWVCPLNLRHVCPTMKNNWNEKFIVMWEVRNINLLSKQFIRTVNIWRAEKLQYVLVLCRLGSVRF